MDADRRSPLATLRDVLAALRKPKLMFRPRTWSVAIGEDPSFLVLRFRSSPEAAEWHEFTIHLEDALELGETLITHARKGRPLLAAQTFIPGQVLSMTGKDARGLLKSMGLRVETLVETGDGIRPHVLTGTERVVRVEPPPETWLQRGESVLLYVTRS